MRSCFRHSPTPIRPDLGSNALKNVGSRLGGGLCREADQLPRDKLTSRMHLMVKGKFLNVVLISLKASLLA